MSLSGNGSFTGHVNGRRWKTHRSADVTLPQYSGDIREFGKLGCTVCVAFLAPVSRGAQPVGVRRSCYRDIVRLDHRDWDHGGSSVPLVLGLRGTDEDSA